ncbi:hemophore [Mycolicibacterium sp. CH28]|nr:hemophore [Mycolicibacterium sp. CH28]
MRGARRGLCGALTVTAVGGAAVLALASSSATAAPDPCAASQIAKTVGTVATNTGTYLDTHPQTNQALTAISQQQAGPQTVVALKSYFDANPQAGKDLQTIQQPLSGLSGQCKLPVSLPQLLGMLQSAQAGSLPSTVAGALPGGPPAQAVAGNQALPVQAVAGNQAPSGSGPLPGPATFSTR